MNPKPRTIYRIVSDVANPKPDRRRAEREVFSAPVIKAGTLIVCRARPDSEALCFEVAGRGYWQTGSSDNYVAEWGAHAELWPILTADGVLAEYPPQDVDQVLLAEDENAHGEGVLEILVALGRVSLDEVRQLWRTYDAADTAASAALAFKGRLGGGS